MGQLVIYIPLACGSDYLGDKQTYQCKLRVTGEIAVRSVWCSARSRAGQLADDRVV